MTIVLAEASPNSLRAARIMTELGFAHTERLETRGGFQHRHKRTAPGASSRCSRTVRVQIGRNQLRATQYHSYGSVEGFHREGATLTDDDIVGIVIHDGVTVLMQRLQQTTFTNHERRSARFLAGEEPGRRHRAGKDVIFIDADSHASQSARDIASRADCCS